jgi:hypothetical protein
MTEILQKALAEIDASLKSDTYGRDARIILDQLASHIGDVLVYLAAEDRAQARAAAH